MINNYYQLIRLIINLLSIAALDCVFIGSVQYMVKLNILPMWQVESRPFIGTEIKCIVVTNVDKLHFLDICVSESEYQNVGLSKVKCTNKVWPTAVKVLP